MVRKRYTEEQIIAVPNEAEAGARTADLCRKHGMSDATFYNWKAKYAGLTLRQVCVLGLLRRLTPARDTERIKRATRLRPTQTPRAPSSACILGAPYVPWEPT